MIIGHFHEGSGTGNQLHRYVFTRVKAADLGVPFGMTGTFKGKDWMPLDMGEPVPDLSNFSIFNETRVRDENGVDISPYDPLTESITDNTIVDGEFQDEKYFEHRLDEVREWLAIRPPLGEVTTCVINFRGGEYVGVPDLFLSKEYWDLAIKEILESNPEVEFEVHSDDIETARIFFPNYPIFSNIETNWRAVRYAPYLILSNSSFGILPALLNKNAKKIIAPKHWARRNIGVQSMQQNIYKKFTHI